MAPNEIDMNQRRTVEAQDVPDVTGLTARDRANLLGREESRNQAYSQDAIDKALKCMDEATLARCRPQGL